MPRKQKPLTIGFFYYNYFPITGGASVHGYNLAKELSEKGYTLKKVNGDSDPFSQKEKGLYGFFKAIVQSDVVFVRLDYFFKPRNIIPFVAKIFGKPVVAELNSPSDELLLNGHSRVSKWVKEKWLKLIVQKVDKLITVSQPVKEFCVKVLEHDKVEVIENGGEVFDKKNLNISISFNERLEAIKKSYSKIIIWTGTTNKIQEMDYLMKIAKALESQYAMLIISPEEFSLEESIENKENIFRFSSLTRDELGWAIQMADIGLALFTDYDWCKWGYYGSSLKVYEYLSNHTLVLTNKEEVVKKHSLTKMIEDPSAINSFCKEVDNSAFKEYSPRTWNQVSLEFISIVNEVVEEDK